MTAVSTDPKALTAAPAPQRGAYAPEILIVVVLAVTAALVRWHGLPTNGLWLDDAVTATGLKASASQMLSVNFDHPGYAVALIVWSRLIGSSALSLAYPAFLAGVIGPPLLYLTLRRFGYSRPIAALLGAALVACQTDIVYSGRVKTYTLDLLSVLAFALILPRLAQMRWKWQTGVLWAVAAVLIGSLSLFTLVSTAVAGFVLALHPHSDRRVRLAAVGTQAAAYLAFILSVGHNYNLGGQDVQWRQTWDAFITFNPNPFRFGSEVFHHLVEVAEVFPGGPAWFAALCAVVAIIGLVGAAVGRRRAPAIRAQYFLLLLLVAFLGALAGKFPFGPIQQNPISSGGRASIWLVPVMAVGLAAAMQFLCERLSHDRAMYLSLNSALYIAAVVILVLALGQKALPYPFPGAKSAADFAESALGPHDVLLVPSPAQYSLAAESDFAVSLHPAPQFADPRIVLIGVQFSANAVASDVRLADRVFVYIPEPAFHTAEAKSSERLDSVLAMAGFYEQPLEQAGQARVEVWRNSTGSAVDRFNLRLSDLPSGWRATPPASHSVTASLLACIGDADTARAQSVFAATRSAPKISVTSEVTVWPSADQSQRAYLAFTQPRADHCLASALQSGLRSVGLPTSVSVNRVSAPATNGDPAVAYVETIQTVNGKTDLAHGTTSFFTHGSTGILLSALSPANQPPPSALVSRLVATLANRVSS